jgi:hypothetical protein
MLKFKGLNKKKKLIAAIAVLSLACLGTAVWLLFPSMNLLHHVLGRQRSSDYSQNRRDVPISQRPELEGPSTAAGSMKIQSAKSELILATREMLRQQIGLAEGTEGAGRRLREAMSAVNAILAGVDVRQLSAEECDSVAIYVLSGGRPEFLERIVDEMKLEKGRQQFFEGAIAFVKGDLKSATPLLVTVDAAKFEPILAARINMLQAQLQDKAPYEQRLKKLETAINLSLGTLFEEAATRRLVALAAENAAVDDLSYWSDRYQRRFPNSAYFSDFWIDTQNGIFVFEKHPEKVSLNYLHDLVARLPEAHRVAFIRQLILRAIKEGQPRLCQFGFEEAQASAGKTGEFVEKLRLYKLVCSIGTMPEEVGPRLSLLDQGKLDPNEIELLDAARLLTQGIMTEAAATKQVADIYGPSPGYPGIEAVKARSASVAQQFDATDAVLNRAEK